MKCMNCANAKYILFHLVCATMEEYCKKEMLFEIHSISTK